MEEERIGLFIDYENLAIGARQDLGMQFDFKPIALALAERDASSCVVPTPIGRTLSPIGRCL